MKSFSHEFSASCLVVTNSRVAHDGHLQTPSCSVARQRCRFALSSRLSLSLVPARDLSPWYCETKKAFVEGERAQVVISEKLFRFLSMFTKLVRGDSFAVPGFLRLVVFHVITKRWQRENITPYRGIYKSFV